MQDKDREIGLHFFYQTSAICILEERRRKEKQAFIPSTKPSAVRILEEREKREATLHSILPNHHLHILQVNYKEKEPFISSAQPPQENKQRMKTPSSILLAHSQLHLLKEKEKDTQPFIFPTKSSATYIRDKGKRETGFNSLYQNLQLHILDEPEGETDLHFFYKTSS